MENVFLMRNLKGNSVMFPAHLLKKSVMIVTLIAHLVKKNQRMNQKLRITHLVKETTLKPVQKLRINKKCNIVIFLCY